MANAENTAPDEAPFIELDNVQAELLCLIGHLQLVDQRLWDDFAQLPQELQPAATVLHKTTAALDELYNRLDLCNVRIANTVDAKIRAGWREGAAAEGVSV